MKRIDFKNIALGIFITSLLVAGLILLPGVVLASSDFQAAGTGTATASATAGLPATGTSTYIVQPVDTLSSIALAHGVTVMSIVNANPQIKDPNFIVNGEKLTIPAPDLKPGESIWAGYNFNAYPSVAQFLSGLAATGPQGTATAAAPGVATATPGIPATGPSTYVIQPPDTLSSVALAHRVTVQSILDANPSIGNPNIVFVGEKINIPAPNLKPGESIWAGYNFNAHPSAGAAAGAAAAGTATAAAPAATSAAPAATATATTAPAATTPAAMPSETPTATPTP
jgi:LysM repeat protein